MQMIEMVLGYFSTIGIVVLLTMAYAWMRSR